MAYKILTKNGIDNSNIDGARGEYFNSGMRDGIVQGVLNEGLFTATASNIISLDTCELRIAGHRIVIDEPVYHTFTNAPSTDTRYAFVVQIVVDDNQNVDFSLFVQSASTPLIQNDLYKTISGAGTYQVEIGRFTLLTSLTIEDVVRTIDVITGGTGKGSGANINIGNVTTLTLDSDVNAEVDVSERYEEDEGKEYLDFQFGIPKGDKGDAGGTVAELVPSGTDINTYRGENYWGKTFYAGGSNTVQNTPIAGIAFSLEVLRSGAFATTQRITMLAVGSNNQPTVYTRSVSDSTTTSADGTWTAWTEVAEEQGEYPSMGAGKFIGTRVAENTDLNSLIPSSSKTALHYYCDSIAAAQTFENCPVDVPFNMITFAPQASGGRYSQILFAISMPEMIFSRYCNNNSWSAWRQYATTDGTYPDMTVGKASGDGNGNQIIAHSSRNTLLDGTTSYNFNDYVEWGNYELHGTPDNPLVNAPTSTSNPSSSNSDWYLSVFKRDSVYVTQVVYSVRSDAAMAIRVLANGNWGEWKTIGEGGGSGDYDLLYSMFSEDESVNFGYTSGLMAGDSIALNTKPYNRLKIYAWLNSIPAQIDVKINDTIKNEFVLSATPSTFTGFYFLKVQLTTVKTRFLVLKYSTFTYNTTDGTFDFVQGTAHPNFYIYRIEGYEKINA